MTKFTNSHPVCIKPCRPSGTKILKATFMPAWSTRRLSSFSRGLFFYPSWLERSHASQGDFTRSTEASRSSGLTLKPPNELDELFNNSSSSESTSKASSSPKKCKRNYRKSTKNCTRQIKGCWITLPSKTPSTECTTSFENQDDSSLRTCISVELVPRAPNFSFLYNLDH